MVATAEAGGWPEDVWGPSAEPWNDDFPVPKELTEEGIDRVVKAFADGAKRAIEAGFDVIEIHNAHGYLLSSFLSPCANKRTDSYGGSFENRTRLTLRVVEAVKAVIPSSTPLFLRISATDWMEWSNEPSWTLKDTVRLASILAKHGVDFLDISSGGNHKAQKIDIAGIVAPHAPFSEAVKREVGDSLIVGAVGGITDGHIAQEILDKGQADAILVGRQFQKNPGAVWAFADDLGVEIKVAHQIEWGWKGRGIGGKVPPTAKATVQSSKV